MRAELEMVEKFMRENGYPPPGGPTAHLDPAIALQRLHLMAEELGDVSRGLNERDLELIADGLCDLLYVVYGTAVATGLAPILPALFAEVHRSNMTKELGQVTDGRRGARKGLGYEPPRLAELLDAYADQLKQIDGAPELTCGVSSWFEPLLTCELKKSHEGLMHRRGQVHWGDQKK